MRGRIAGLVALAAVLWGPNAFGETITIGHPAGRNGFPFGAGPPDPNAYFGEYQQIYAANAFGGVFAIEQIAFQTVADPSPHSMFSSFTLSVGTTATSPTAPGDSYAANRGADLTPVFSGTVVVPTTGSGNFDFIIPLTVPFVYDPANGNLLLDVFVHLNSSEFTGFSAAVGPVGRIFNVNGTGFPVGAGNEGLLTQFSGGDIDPVPEPTTLALFGTGLAGVIGRAWRRRKPTL
jgi:hypothetical protein